MLVLNCDMKDRASIIDSLDCYSDAFANMLKDCVEDDEEKAELEQQVEYTSDLYKRAQDLSLQELVERCMSYFWDRLSDGGAEDWPEIEALEEDMGIEEWELLNLFNMAGYREE